MTETTRRQKPQPTPQQSEIARLVAKGASKRTDQESARLDQLKSEERRARFLRLAPRRVRNAIKQLTNVSRLGNRATYDYTTEEATRIGAALNEKFEEVYRAFQPKQRDEGQFSL